MSLRSKLVIALVGCTTVASLVVGTLSYRAMSSRMLAEIDVSLETASASLSRPDRRNPAPGRALRGGIGFAGQLLGPDGEVLVTSSADEVGRTESTIEPLPVGVADREIAQARTPGVDLLRTVQYDGDTVRLLTTSIGESRGAFQIARSLGEIDRVLDDLRQQILWLTLGVAVVSGGIGWLIARQITARLQRVTVAAESVAADGDLDIEVPVEGKDEAARLGSAFNDMLGALASSRADQQRLVQDAGHELRTPMTSVRTNLYALRSVDALTDEQRDRALSDIELETAELSRLIDEVIEVATDRRVAEPMAEVGLRELITQAVDVEQPRTARQIELLDASPDSADSVMGRPESLRRAVRNLLENSLKFDTSNASIEVSVVTEADRGVVVSVADRGPGFEAADIPHVFDRFFRSETARAEPGSGLGLSIVAQIIEEHGGTVFAANRDGGGAVVGFSLPTL